MKTKDITFGGIMVGLGIIILYLTTIIPINTLSLLTLASCIIPICIIRSNIKTSILVYLGTSIISFFIIPINYAVLYTCFFGIYGLIKFFIEKVNNIKLEILLKFIFFNTLLFSIILLMSNIITNMFSNLPIYIIFLGAQLGFAIYDYVLTLIISLCIKKFKQI
ncbi:hypothetical protein [uncultured Clostridium sp.]|uniref:hypothetical protein n=1 Tax=uncultured Clostridium sp. TaxID=59620 RepID=UPI0025F0F2FE|nr:hypothetical protein [uncultured Clostridium sp.]